MVGKEKKLLRALKGLVALLLPASVIWFTWHTELILDMEDFENCVFTNGFITHGCLKIWHMFMWLTFLMAFIGGFLLLFDMILNE